MEDLQPEDWDCTMEQHSVLKQVLIIVICDFLNLWHLTFLLRKSLEALSGTCSFQHWVLNTMIVL